MSSDDLCIEQLTALGPALLRYLDATCPSYMDTEGLCQDVLLTLYVNRSQWKGIDSLEAWSIKIAKNKVVDEHRRERKRRNYKDKYSEYHAFRIACMNSCQSDFFHDLAIFQSGLEDQEKEILGLWVEGVSYSEIARKTNSSSSAIGRCIHRMKTALASFLSKNGYGNE
ncbi:RNA polymerase sigma factor [Gimesia fumaroli]|uniref:RNA polymerase sigma factor n=1 Tax=Gimesia fumaroli TaxID=2527976 RepID=A0A518I5P2_9PLAN|nr:RNA polymerase sigma factor [Gimesia fumaroli]QDV48416.1 RNA polymerase sigma factor [Gimesia fumaroli]